jgi:hypothetical protein
MRGNDNKFTLEVAYRGGKVARTRHDDRLSALAALARALRASARVTSATLRLPNGNREVLKGNSPYDG